jgi:hypothetical protein
MNLNRWTVGLLAGGVVSLGSVVQAEESHTAVQTALESTTISGYVDTSAIWKFGTGNAALPGRAFDGAAKVDGFNLNVVKLTVEKPIDESQWAAGYRIDIIAGPDAVGYNAVLGGGGDFGLKDAYVALRAPVGNGLDFKIGTFSTVIGYEVFESPNNPNYSRSFGWQLEPTQHTGVLASYQVCEGFSLSAGVANTWNAGINARPVRLGSTAAESEKTYLASAALTAPDSLGFLAGATLYGGIVDGLAGNTTDTTSYYAGATLPTPVEGLALGLAYDYVDDSPLLLGGSNHAWALAGYLSYQVTEQLKINTRADYTRGTGGIWYAPAPDGDENELFALTATLDYSLWANVLSRLELRWDHALDGSKPYGRVATPYGGGDRNALTLALNVVYKF